MLQPYLRLVIKRPVIPIIILAGITIFLAFGMSKLKFDSSLEAFMPKNDSAYLKYTQTKKVFGDNGRFVIMAVSAKNLWSSAAFEEFDRLICDIETYQDYHPQKEKKQLETFYEIIHQKPVSLSNILEVFRDDPEFSRFLQRKAKRFNMAHADPLTPKNIRRLTRAVEENTALKKLEIIDTILSPFTLKDISGENDTLETYDLIEKDDNGRRILPKTAQEMSAFEQRLKKNPVFETGIYAADPETGEITDFAVIVKFVSDGEQEPVVHEIIEIVEGYTNPLHITCSGVPYMNDRFNAYLEKDLRRSVPLVLLVVTFVFFFNFRSVRGVILPLFTLGMAEVWTLGLMGHTGFRITAVAITLPPLLIAVGSSYAIHILNQYYNDFDLITLKGKREGLQEAMQHISTTVFLAGFTTFAAFISMVTSQITALREWAVFSAAGVLFAVFISVTLIPAALALMPHRFPAALTGKDKTPRTTFIDRLLVIIAKGSVLHYKKIYVVVGIILGVSLIGASRVSVNTEFLHYFKESDPIRQNVVITGKKLGGGWGFNIVIDSKAPDGIKSPEFLNTLEKIRQWLVADENPDLNVGRTDAFADYIKRMHMAMNNDDPAYFKIPENKADILDYLEIYTGEDEDSDGRVDDFEPFVDRSFRKSNILVRLTHKTGDLLGTKEDLHIINRVKQHLAKTLPKNYAFSVSGFPEINAKMAHYVVTGQMQGLLLSLLAVAAVIILLFRKFTAGPLAMIDMSVTILINFGIMGFCGIALDMVTSVIAAITIGIGVDDTIHFLNTYRHHKGEDTSPASAIERTTFRSGKAILFTSLALICGFTVLSTSNFLPIILFGLLIALTMINTTIGSILLVPSAIRMTNIDLNRPSRFLKKVVPARLGKSLAPSDS